MKRIGFLLSSFLIISAWLWASSPRVLMVIAHHNFRDEELFVTKSILEKAGFKVEVASSSLSPAKGMLGGSYKPDLLLKDVNLDKYQAIVFVGGSGATEYWDDKQAHRLIKQAIKKGKVVAAICIAPITLAKAGILKGKKATVWPSEAKLLESLGAIYTGQPVQQDGRIITANGPWAAADFAKTIIRTLR